MDNRNIQIFIELLGLRCPINCDLHMAQAKLFPNMILNLNSQRKDATWEAKPTQMRIRYTCTNCNFMYFTQFRLPFKKSRCLEHKYSHTTTYLFSKKYIFKMIKIYYFLFHMICRNYQLKTEIFISDKEMKWALGEN